MRERAACPHANVHVHVCERAFVDVPCRARDRSYNLGRVEAGGLVSVIRIKRAWF